MQKMKTHAQLGIIYKLATKLGIYEKDNKDDNLHALVFAQTKKDSLSKMTFEDAENVIAALRKMTNEPKAPQAVSGMITADQKKLVWRYMYRLKELDEEPSSSPLGQRLCGVIERNLHITARIKNPFQFITFEDGQKLVEVTKHMVLNKEKKLNKKFIPTK